MDPHIKFQAEHLCQVSTIDNKYKVDVLKDKIENFISQFYSPEDKNEFLNYYLGLMNEKFRVHKLKCDKEDCEYAIINRSVNFFVKQEFQKIKGEQEQERFLRFGTIIENLTIHGDGQVLNFGKVEGDIRNNAQILTEKGNSDISQAIGNLVSAIKDSNEINDLQRKEYFDTLKLLSGEALKAKDNRLPYSTLKTIIKYSLGTLNAFSSVATVTGVDLAYIADFFLNE